MTSDEDPEMDADAVGVAILSRIINFRHSAWTLGAPLGLDDRFLNGFADRFAALVSETSRNG
jgi:hypothetical protein